MVIPNMDLASNHKTENVTLFYDVSTKKYGIRKSEEIVQDGVHIEATKSVVMTREQLEKLIETAKTFIKDRP
jgi:hypothetical protein